MKWEMSMMLNHGNYLEELVDLSNVESFSLWVMG